MVFAEKYEVERCATCISLGAPELGIALQLELLGHFCSLLSNREITVFNRHAYRAYGTRCCNTLSIPFLGPLNRSRICYLFLVTVRWVILRTKLICCYSSVRI